MKQLQFIFLAPFISIFIFLVSFHTATAQVETDTILASQYFNKAEALLKENKYDNAITSFKKALKIYEKTKDKNPGRYITTKIELGNVYLTKIELDSSLYYFDNALKTSLKEFGSENYFTLRCYSSLGSVYRRKGELDKALEYNEKTLKYLKKIYDENHMHIGLIYNNIGSILMNKGENDKALEYYNKALKIISLQVDENSPYISIVLMSIGNIHNYKYEYEKASSYYKKSLDIKLKNYGENHPEISDVYINLGLVYLNLQKTEQALFYYQKAIDITTKLFGANHPSIASAYINIGSAYRNLQKTDQALFYYQKAINILKTSSQKNIRNTSGAMFNIGLVYKDAKEYDKALIYFQKAIENEKKYRRINNPTIIESLIASGNLFFQQEKFKKALEYYNEASRENLIKSVEITSNKQNKYSSLIHEVSILEKKGKVYRNIYKNEGGISHIKSSNSCYQKAEKFLDILVKKINDHNDKLEFSKNIKEINEGALLTQFLWYTTQKDIRNLEQAFYHAEKSKANTLKGLLNESYAKEFAGLPIELIELGKKLKTNRAFYQSQITDELSSISTDSTKIKEYENELFDIDRKQDSLTELLEKNYPKYYQLKYQNSIISVPEIQKKLKDNQTLLEFFVADSIFYAFTISKNDISVKELATPKLRDKVQEFRNSITSKNLQEYKQLANQLYNTLLASVANKFIGDELIIVPDGPLWHLNFELLLTQKDDSNNPTDLSYLLKDYAITYANSANLLFAPFKTNDQSKILQECLAFSFSDSTHTTESNTMRLATLRNAGDDLPGTRKEIKAIADIIDGQYYYGSQAVEANFKNNASKYNILHLALHGEVDNERPENSKLYFTKSKDTIEDNLLYSYELFALDIPAELTVLSACNTGTGKIAKGEGVMSLGNAFQYAGTKSLLLTSWEVSDRTTPELMKYFYTNLKAGMNKGKALQQAKLQYLKTANINRTHPFYWGGFYLVGDTSPMHFNDNSRLYWILGLGILACLFLIVFWYRKNSTKR
ncbi:CHAT domain-containing protein [Aquimarina sp. 2304DJ70-9]|uniref:CHAT domain-containing protein n=1 Tax=Aquimarina penaris TaxID=3231044 RepID=UPI003461B991